MTTPSGLLPVLATPFQSDGTLDETSLGRLVEFQRASGADGLALFGMASETFALTDTERARILTTVRRLAPDLPLAAGVGATAAAGAVEQARWMADSGADALVVLPPFMVRPSGSQLVDFYGEVAAVTPLPVLVQDAPGPTGVSMPVPTLVELSKLDGVTSVKIEAQPTAPKVGTVVDSTDTDFSVLGGQNALFCLEEYARGAVGTMPACEFTDVLRTVLDDWLGGRRREARTAFASLLPLIRFGLQPGIAWAIHKEVLVARGVIADATVRAPAADLDAGSRAALRDILDDLHLATWPQGSGQ